MVSGCKKKMANGNTTKDVASVKLVFEDCLPGPDDILDIDMEVTSLTIVEDANGDQVVTGSNVFDNYFYTQADFIGGGVIENVKLPIEGSFEINVGSMLNRVGNGVLLLD